MMSISISKIIVWLIVGALAGTVAGRLMTFTKRGFGLWVNMGVGMLGALVGGLIFRLLHIDLGLGEIKATFEDLISAFIGSVLCIVAWRFIRKNGGVQKERKPAG
jgi:uncharacterized membrane protein YeaQ/YmgE (transglycosylase-associated protein family)